jgi:hypothetical protein
MDDAIMRSMDEMLVAPFLHAAPRAVTETTSHLDSLVLCVRGGEIEVFDKI